MFLNVRYIRFWYLESHFRNGTWKKHPTFHIAVSTPLTGGAVGAWVSSWQLPIPRWGHDTDIATRTNMNQTKLMSKFGSFFLVSHWYFASQVVACYVVSILRQLTNLLPSRRGSIHHWKTPGGATPVPIFLGWFMSFWCFSSQLSQTLTANKKASVFRCFPHGVATQHLHLCLVALDHSRRYLQRGGAAHGTADVAALGGGEKRLAVWLIIDTVDGSEIRLTSWGW